LSLIEPRFVHIRVGGAKAFTCRGSFPPSSPCAAARAQQLRSKPPLRHRQYLQYRTIQKNKSHSVGTDVPSSTITSHSFGFRRNALQRQPSPPPRRADGCEVRASTAGRARWHLHVPNGIMFSCFHVPATHSTDDLFAGTFLQQVTALLLCASCHLCIAASSCKRPVACNTKIPAA
jgi:hypothetical protein